MAQVLVESVKMGCNPASKGAGMVMEVFAADSLFFYPHLVSSFLYELQAVLLNEGRS